MTRTRSALPLSVRRRRADNYLFNDIIYKTALYIQINEHKKCSFILKNISKCNIFTIFLPNLLKSLKYPCAFKNILGVI
jgi:hypothetical protein